MQPVYARRHEAGTPSRAADHIEAFGVRRQLLPGKAGEIIAENAIGLDGIHALPSDASEVEAGLAP